MTRPMRERLGGSMASAWATPAQLLARLGRLALWLAVGLVLLRGAGNLFAG